MPNFNERSYQKELLDRDDIPFEAIQQNMKELDRINTLLGGHDITITGLKYVLDYDNTRIPVRICEIGCGGGDNLRVIRDWCRLYHIEVELMGVDINPHCIAYAQSRKENKGIEFVCSDYLHTTFQQQPHIIFSSLFGHHLDKQQFVQMLQWCNTHALLGHFINDLQRHYFAYHSIKLLTSAFSNSYLVKNDAPLSVLRGFSKEELENMFVEAGITHYEIQWKWAFRWLICSITNKPGHGK